MTTNAENIYAPFDNLIQNFSVGEGKSDHPVGNLFTLLGQNDKYIAGTYNAYLKRPELFKLNAQTLLYALDVGQTFKKDALFIMFRGFLQHPPETSESSIIFSWAEELRKGDEFMSFEPVFDKLNSILRNWFAKKTVEWKGRAVPLELFRPILYNSAGVNLIELLPYITYLFTYHVYGYPFHFSDALSSSSMKSYLNSLENWLAKCYAELYKEQQINLLNTRFDEKEIDDETWIAFYETALYSSKIVQLRNDEIRRTDGLLDGMINDQQSMNDSDLQHSFNAVMTKLVEIAVQQTPFNQIYSKIHPFDASYYDSTELANITSYMVTECEQTVAIDANDYFRYMLMDSKIEPFCSELELNLSKDRFGLKKLSTCIGKPFCSGDQSLEIFKGYLRAKFEGKRSFSLDASPIYLTPSDLDASNLYPFILKWFVNGVWALEHNEMYVIIQGLLSNKTTAQYLKDMFAIRKTFEIVYGNTTQAILTPVYAISMLNTWARIHAENGLEFNDFNPFLYIKDLEIDEARVIKLENILYSMLFLNSKAYISFANKLITNFYEMMTSKPILIQPFVQAFDDSARVFCIGGVDCYRFAKYSNPLVRGYGFLSRVSEMNEEIYVAYRFAEQIHNETIFELIEDKKNDTKSIVSTLASASKKTTEPPLLFKYKFAAANGKLAYIKRAKGSWADLVLDSKSVPAILRSYSFKQSLPADALPSEIVSVKRLEVKGNGKLEANKPITKNGYDYNSKFISIKLSGTGTTKYIPIYAPATSVTTRNLAMVNPDGLKLVEVITPSSGILVDNNVFWIYTSVTKSKFAMNKKEGEVDLKASGYQPRSGTYMLTDRIQGLPLI